MPLVAYDVAYIKDLPGSTIKRLLREAGYQHPVVDTARRAMLTHVTVSVALRYRSRRSTHVAAVVAAMLNDAGGRDRQGRLVLA